MELRSTADTDAAKTFIAFVGWQVFDVYFG